MAMYNTHQHGKDVIVLEPALRLKQLINSSAVQVDINIPLRRYFRSGQEMIRMAITYHEEGSLEQAYTLYLKYMALFLQEISKHPEYPTYSHESKNKNKKHCMKLLSIAEDLKKQLSNRYQKEYEVFVAQQVQIEQQLRREQAAEEEQRRHLQEQEDERHAKQRQADAALHLPVATVQISDTCHVLPSAPAHLPDDSPPPQYDDTTSSSLYPHRDLPHEVGAVLPSAPDHPYTPSSPSTTPSLPSRSLKPSHSIGGSSRPSSASSSTPSVDRSSKPTSLLGGGGGVLRTVRVPSSLVTEFMKLAAPNTARNVETCGVLAGSLRLGVLFVTHLLVPQQSGTPDSCTTHQEEELFQVQDTKDIITLGWIHTHPSQTAFLSSVDLHTHCSYQLMMPEAIAIVCAPSHNETSIFTLTPDHGLNYVANCRETGFHPHPQKPVLFKEADHAVLETEGSVEVIDLRK